MTSSVIFLFLFKPIISIILYELVGLVGTAANTSRCLKYCFSPPYTLCISVCEAFMLMELCACSRGAPKSDCILHRSLGKEP